MRIIALNIPFYFWLSLLAIGTLFKIQHWPYGHIYQLVGLCIEVLFFILVMREIITSKKARGSQKVVFTTLFVVVPFLAYSFLPALILVIVIFIIGTAYLKFLRKKFLFTRTELDKGNFDSI